MGGDGFGDGGLGGGIYNQQEMLVINSTIEDNFTGNGGLDEEIIGVTPPESGQGGDGGGLYNTGSMLIIHSQIEGNRTGNGGPGDMDQNGGRGGSGGGVFNSGTSTITYSSVISNITGTGGSRGGSGGNGGGISSSGSLTMNFCVAKTNSTGQGSDEDMCGDVGHGGHGGGIYNVGQLKLNGLSMLGNFTGPGGSCIHSTTGWRSKVVWGSSESDVFAVRDNSTILQSDSSSWTITNTSPPDSGGFGGGIYISNSNNATLNNGLVAENRVAATGYGSGIYISDSSMNMLHPTLASNTGGDGSGIYLISSTVTLTNTILVSHTVGISATQDSSMALDYTLWGEGVWANGMNYGGDGIINHTHDLSGDPGFAAPQAGDYHILSSSAAIDQGIEKMVATDLDNQPRPNPNTAVSDLGSDEYWEFTAISEVNLTGPITATAYTPVTFTATINPATATPNVHYIWTPMPHSGQGEDTAVFKWSLPLEYNVTVIAENAGSSVAASKKIKVFGANIDIFLPGVWR
jgi:hypothetical protein